MLCYRWNCIYCIWISRFFYDNWKLRRWYINHSVSGTKQPGYQWLLSATSVSIHVTHKDVCFELHKKCTEYNIISNGPSIGNKRTIENHKTLILSVIYDRARCHRFEKIPDLCRFIFSFTKRTLSWKQFKCYKTQNAYLIEH